MEFDTGTWINRYIYAHIIHAGKLFAGVCIITSPIGHQELLHRSCRRDKGKIMMVYFVHLDGKSRLVRINYHWPWWINKPWTTLAGYWLVIGCITLHTIDGYWRANNYNHIGWVFGLAITLQHLTPGWWISLQEVMVYPFSWVPVPSTISGTLVTNLWLISNYAKLEKWLMMVVNMANDT